MPGRSWSGDGRQVLARAEGWRESLGALWMPGQDGGGTECHQVVYLKVVNFTLCEFHLFKKDTGFKKKRKRMTLTWGWQTAHRVHGRVAALEDYVPCGTPGWRETPAGFLPPASSAQPTPGSRLSPTGGRISLRPAGPWQAAPTRGELGWGGMGRAA